MKLSPRTAEIWVLSLSQRSVLLTARGKWPLSLFLSGCSWFPKVNLYISPALSAGGDVCDARHLRDWRGDHSPQSPSRSGPSLLRIPTFPKAHVPRTSSTPCLWKEAVRLLCVSNGSSKEDWIVEHDVLACGAYNRMCCRDHYMQLQQKMQRWWKDAAPLWYGFLWPKCRWVFLIRLVAYF